MVSLNLPTGDAVSSVIAGIKLTMKEPTLRKEVVKGFFFNALLFLVLLAGLLWGAWALTGLLIGEGWLAATLGWVARIMVLAGVVLAAPVVYVLAGEIILPTFRGNIFREGRRLSGAQPPQVALGFKAEARSVAIDIRRLVRFLGFSILALPLNLIPLVGSVLYLVFQGLIAAHTMGWDVLSRHFELYDLRYKEQLRILRTNRVLVLSVGTVAVLLCLIPIAQLLFLSTNIAGAGILSAKLDRRAHGG